MRYFFILMIFSTSLFSSSIQAQCTHLSISGTIEYPPYLWQNLPDETIHGAVVEYLNLLSQKTNIEFKVLYTGSWARTQMELKADRLDMLAGLFYNDERAKIMDFLQPAIAYSNARLWMHKDHSLNVTSLEQLQDLKGASVIGFSLGKTFDNYANQHLKIERVRSITQAFKMLASQRVDYVSYEEQPGIAISQTMDINTNNLQMLPYLISSEGIYIAISKHSKCNSPELKRKLEQGMQQLAQERIMEKLIMSAQEEWRALSKP